MMGSILGLEPLGETEHDLASREGWRIRREPVDVHGEGDDLDVGSGRSELPRRFRQEPGRGRDRMRLTKQRLEAAPDAVGRRCIEGHVRAPRAHHQATCSTVVVAITRLRREIVDVDEVGGDRAHQSPPLRVTGEPALPSTSEALPGEAGPPGPRGRELHHGGSRAGIGRAGDDQHLRPETGDRLGPPSGVGRPRLAHQQDGRPLEVLEAVRGHADQAGSRGAGGAETEATTKGNREVLREETPMDLGLPLSADRMLPWLPLSGPTTEIHRTRLRADPLGPRARSDRLLPLQAQR
jgi:hypothetical protein